MNIFNPEKNRKVKVLEYFLHVPKSHASDLLSCPLTHKPSIGTFSVACLLSHTAL